MGHKTHPLGFRLGISQDHKSKWHTNLNSYAQFIKEDFQIRNLILESLSNPELKSTGITKILLHRSTSGEKINIVVHTAKPAALVGLKGSNLNELDQNLGKLLPTKKTLLDIVEILTPEIHFHADLIADMLVIQLEGRIPFRRAMKGILEEVKQQKKIEGIKIQIAGRVNGAEIARTEWLREGRVPLQTLRANIDYSYKTAQTVYGILGIKIWLFKGNVVGEENI